MPTTRTRRTRQQAKLSAAAMAYLQDTPTELEGTEGFTLWAYRAGIPGPDWEPSPDFLWRRHKKNFLPTFILQNPGRRPAPWWHWTAPRQPDQGSNFWFEGALPEPRLRIGGKGQLQKGCVPFYQYGIPEHWNEATLDETDPPVFESQAAYLLRYGLLTESEKTFLKKHPEILEPEKIRVS